ncbi:MAG: aminodeoxychorismate/anthranilate synthase component II [Alphaproteobacteria bacterium]
MYLLIDNYDSFTYNLYHFLGELGATVEVRRNDALTVDDAMAMKAEGIIISPGPCTPNEAGISLDLVRACAERSMPLLGVCLGHQSIGQAFGGEVLRAPSPMHGKVSRIHHAGTDIFADMPDPFQATRYHSLIVDRGTMPNCLTVTAETEDGLVMGVAHCDLPIYGVQFHPESIATEDGRRLLGNFLKLSKG